MASAPAHIACAHGYNVRFTRRVNSIDRDQSPNSTQATHHPKLLRPSPKGTRALAPSGADDPLDRTPKFGQHAHVVQPVPLAPCSCKWGGPVGLRSGRCFTLKHFILTRLFRKILQVREAGSRLGYSPPTRYPVCG
jgi:hypothetical protein